MNRAATEFVASYDGPKNDFYFGRLRELDRDDAPEPVPLPTAVKVTQSNLSDVTGWHVYSPAELREMVETPADDLIGGVLPGGGRLRCYGRAGAGKSTLKQYLLAALATGRPFLGRFAIQRPVRVLDLQAELSKKQMRGHILRLDEHGFAGADFEANFRTVRLTQLRLPEHEPVIRAAIARWRPEVLSVDTVNRFTHVKDVWKDSEWMEVHALYDRLLEDPDLGLLAIIDFAQANASGERVANSFEMEAWPDTMLRLERVKQGALTDRLLTFEKVRDPDSDLQGQALTIRLGDSGYLTLEPSDETPAGVTIVVHVLTRAGDDLSRTNLITSVMTVGHVGQRAAEKYLTQALERKRVMRVGKVGREVIYGLPR